MLRARSWKSTPLVIPYHTVSPGNMLRSNIVEIEQVVLRNKYVFTYTCVHAITMKKRLNLKASGER